MRNYREKIILQKKINKELYTCSSIKEVKSCHADRNGDTKSRQASQILHLVFKYGQTHVMGLLGMKKKQGIICL